jgi:hypothetical protein
LGLKKVKTEERRREKKSSIFAGPFSVFYGGFLDGWDCLMEFRVVDGELV